MIPKTRNFILALAMVVGAAGLLTCSGPSAPDLTEPPFDNPYDERGDNYIPTPDLNTAPVAGIRALRAESGGQFENDYGKPVTAKGVCWSTDEGPTIADNCTNDGEGHNTFTSMMSDLEPDQTYYVRAYATNEAGTIYGGQRSFTTLDGRPEVSIELEGATVHSIRVKGDVVSELPMTSYGVCYDEAPNPDMSSECVDHDGEAGSYSIELAGLTAGTSYHVFAYAVNEMGTGSSAILEVTTRDGIPVLTTTEPFDIRGTSARTGGDVSDDGGADITVRGVCFVVGSGQPSLSDTCVESGSGAGSFEVLLEDLSLDQQYSVRAYATTEFGTDWGQVQAFTTLPFNVVTNPATGRTWMDRNLGASRAATSSTDSQAYGDLYQWGRAADGHQRRNSSTTSTLSSSDQPGHGSFILSTSEANWDWRSPQNDNLWQGVNGTNNPCPPGYRLPTEAEWNAERNSWSSNNASGAFGSPLKLPMAGGRSGSGGSLSSVGSSGYYWSSTVSGSFARRLYFNSSYAGMSSYFRAGGLSVRCLKD